MNRSGYISALALVVASLVLVWAPAVGSPQVQATQPRSTQLHPTLTFDPTRLGLGAVPVDDPDCTFLDDFRGCALATVTLTNDGTSPFDVDGYSVCTTFSKDRSSCEGGEWGGLSDLPNSTCLSAPEHATLQPGESCQMVLVATPHRRGSIKGWVVVWGAATQRIEAALPVRVRGV